MAHITPNTDKDLPCVSCGGPGNIIREGADPRLKCLRCNFLYNGSDSEAAKEAGNIPDGPPVIPDTTLPKVDRNLREPITDLPKVSQEIPPSSLAKIPRTPSYVFISKDRTGVEFATKKTLKQIALRWETQGRTFDCFELNPKKVSAKVTIE